MECEANSISCRLDEIARVLAEPSLLELVSVVLSGLAAAGTIWIAVLNVRLLRKQHDLGVQAYEDARRERRAAHATTLKDLALSKLSARVAGLVWDATTTENRALMTALAVSSEAINDTTVPRPADRTLKIVDAADIMIGDVNEFVAVLNQVIGFLDEWVNDPHGVDMTTRTS